MGFAMVLFSKRSLGARKCSVEPTKLLNALFLSIYQSKYVLMQMRLLSAGLSSITM